MCLLQTSIIFNGKYFRGFLEYRTVSDQAEVYKVYADLLVPYRKSTDEQAGCSEVAGIWV